MTTRKTTTIASAVLAATIALTATPTAARELAFQTNAKAHAHAIQTAWNRLTHHIRNRATSATSWPGDTPPEATGWRPDWTARGLRARYCNNVLLVFMGPPEAMGVGENQRAIQVAPRLFSQTATARPLHWLNGPSAEGGTGRADVTLPQCMIAGLPSGRAALAGAVEDPWTTTTMRTRWETRNVACPPGHHSIAATPEGLKQRRRVRTLVNKKGIAVGTPTYDSWETLVNLCQRDYSWLETDTRPCDFMVAGQQQTGSEVWRRTVTMSSSGETVTAWSKVGSTCPTTGPSTPGTPTGTPDSPPTPRIWMVNRTEERPSTCPDRYEGEARQTRTVTDRYAQFDWDATPTIQTGYTTGHWIDDHTACTPIQPTVWTEARTETRTVACEAGYSGAITEKRTVMDQYSQYPWDALPTITREVSAGDWTVESDSCLQQLASNTPVTDTSTGNQDPDDDLPDPAADPNKKKPQAPQKCEADEGGGPGCGKSGDSGGSENDAPDKDGDGHDENVDPNDDDPNSTPDNPGYGDSESGNDGENDGSESETGGGGGNENDSFGGNETDTSEHGSH